MLTYSNAKSSFVLDSQKRNLSYSRAIDICLAMNRREIECDFQFAIYENGSSFHYFIHSYVQHGEVYYLLCVSVNHGKPHVLEKIDSFEAGMFDENGHAIQASDEERLTFLRHCGDLMFQIESEGVKRNRKKLLS